jgi:uncharacterized membrane protein
MGKATFGLDENVASAACYVLTWLTGIIFFVVEKDNKTVRFHALQSVLTFVSLGIVFVIFMVISGIITLIGGAILGIIFFLIYMLIALAMVVLWLFLMWKAYSGEKFMVPIVGAIAEANS